MTSMQCNPTQTYNQTFGNKGSTTDFKTLKALAYSKRLGTQEVGGLSARDDGGSQGCDYASYFYQDETNTQPQVKLGISMDSKSKQPTLTLTTKQTLTGHNLKEQLTNLKLKTASLSQQTGNLLDIVSTSYQTFEKDGKDNPQMINDPRQYAIDNNLGVFA